MAVSKSEVVSVRVEPRIKAALQAVAEGELRSVANMIEVMVVAYCKEKGVPLAGVSKETPRVAKSGKKP
jgi:hypothetical protein